MNIIAKQDGQATVASREPQNWHSAASVELAAPQFGQLSVSACIIRILAGECEVDYRLNNGGLRDDGCAMLPAKNVH